MSKDDWRDPKGLIREAYRIPGITAEECRSIFLDWALSVADGRPTAHVQYLLTDYGADAPDHPMTHTLRAALTEIGPARRRGGRAARLAGKG